jgi:CheY-like chemotaxis protein
MARILVIDDHTAMRVLLRDILEPEGHIIVDAANGAMGVEAFREAPFDLVITDIIMPGQDGIDTIVQLKRLRPEQKIIVMSGGGRRNSPEFLRIASKLGATDVLAKPFDPADMRQVVRACLE